MAFNNIILQAQITANETTISNYQSILAADALNPLKTYSKDGESLSRNEWRAGLVTAIDELREMNVQLQKMLIKSNPYIIRTGQRM